ncbi:MAG: hypothetical protein RI998_116 [Pseudomonadota bacterium]|jgi:hypothetical protein
MTRPEPTIYGNCDSWDLIVGRKPDADSPKGSLNSALSVRDTIVIHSLFTKMVRARRNNLWANCGSICTTHKASRIVKKILFHIT